MKSLTLPLTTILISAISLTSCNSGTWSSADRKACKDELLQSDDFNSEDIMLEMEALNSIADCMCDVFESEFDTWDRASQIVGSEEWAMNNPETALELAGCFFSAFSEEELEDALDDIEFSEEELEDALESLEEELEDALDDIEFSEEEFEEALESLEEELEVELEELEEELEDALDALDDIQF